MPVDKDRLRAHLIGRAQRHGRMDSEFARFVGGGRDYASLIAAAAHHHGLALQTRIEQLLHGYEERIHVQVEDGFQDRS